MNEKRVSNHLNTRAAIYAAILALCLFATLAAAVAAHHLVSERYPEFIQPFTAWLPESVPLNLAIMAAFSAAIGIGTYALLTRVPTPRGQSDLRTGRLRSFWRFAGREGRADELQAAALAAAIIFIAWLPIIIISYPTGLTADTFNQLYQFQTAAPTFYPTTGELIDAEFIDHHPVFDTLLYGAFWQIGAALGSQNAGIFALAILQSLILAAELGFLTCYLGRLGAPRAARIAALVFFAWFPAFGHYASTVLKDTTYLTVFIPWLLMWVEAARTRGKAFDDRRFLVAFFLLSGACILTKKLGVFLLVPCLALLIIALRDRRAKLALGSAATVLIFCLALPAIVYPAIGGVAPGGKQEALGPAIQQVTALMRNDPDALSADEKAICNKVFDTDRAVKNYEPFRSDPAKSAYHSDATTDDILAFLQVWASAGLRHPVDYLAASVETSGMLYIPFMKITYYSGEDLSSRAANYAQLNPDFCVDVSQPADLVALNDHLEFDSIESRISDLPLISLFFTQGFYGGWIPLIALLLTLYFHKGPARKNVLLALAPILLTTLFLLITPTASPRYILPLLFTTPLTLTLPFTKPRL